MNWFDELLVYAKTTFNLLKSQKIIFIPYLILILLKGAIFLALFSFGMSVAKTFIEGGMKPDLIFAYSFLPTAILGGLAIGLISLIIKSYIDAGTSSLIYLALKENEISFADFWTGANYFFGRFFKGNFMLIFTGIILSPILLVVYIIVGILTLGLGFVAVPLLVSVFLGMWQVSLICNDTDVITSIKNSYRFGKDYFWPFLFVNFLQGIASGFMSFGGGSNNDRGVGYKVNPEELDKIPSYFVQEGLNWLIGLGSIVFGVFFLFSSLIKLIFDIFFKGLYFVMYLNKRAQL